MLMLNPNEVLTISYGTFSRILNVIEDPFEMMRKITGCFCDLVADDHSFGQEPAIAGDNVLAKSAEAETARRDDARIKDQGIEPQALTTFPAETVPRAEQPDPVSEVHIREKIVDSPSAGSVSDTRRERSALHLNYPTFETFAPVSQTNHSAVGVEDKKDCAYAALENRYSAFASEKIQRIGVAVAVAPEVDKAGFEEVLGDDRNIKVPKTSLDNDEIVENGPSVPALDGADDLDANDRQYMTSLSDEDNADLLRKLATLELDFKTDSDAEVQKSRHVLPKTYNTTISKILKKTDLEFSEPRGRRRRAGIARERAVDAATAGLLESETSARLVSPALLQLKVSQRVY
jgi:hypothetical protein